MQDNIICKICGKAYKHLGSHIAKAHKITAREYKKQFGLDYNYPLISESVKIKKQIAFEKDREKYLKNFKGNKKYQFKKGRKTRNYVSKQSIERAKKNIDHNFSGLCPFCEVRYQHLQSHLHLKHNMLLIKISKQGE